MAVIDPLPPGLAKALGEFPRPGERNHWLFQVAVAARGGASPDRVRAFLHRVIQACGWTDRDFGPEIDRAVRRAFQQRVGTPALRRPLAVSQTPHASLRQTPWPNRDPQLQRELIAKDPIFDLTAQPDISTEAILDTLYRPDELLCLAHNHKDAFTAPREKWRGREAGFQYLVASPMRALRGLTQDGKPSSRCHGNATLNRRYQVVEFDEGTLEDQAAILSALHSKRAPLFMVVWSGSKSLHGWFDVRHLTEAEKRQFFAFACRCGADRTLWDQSKLVRMPGGIRSSNKERQAVLYFNPSLLLHGTTTPNTTVHQSTATALNTPSHLGECARAASRAAAAHRALRCLQFRLTGRVGALAHSQLTAHAVYRAQLHRASRKGSSRKGQHSRRGYDRARPTHQYPRPGGHW